MPYTIQELSGIVIAMRHRSRRMHQPDVTPEITVTGARDVGLMPEMDQLWRMHDIALHLLDDACRA
jgi:hypothetical protein